MPLREKGTVGGQQDISPAHLSPGDSLPWWEQSSLFDTWQTNHLTTTQLNIF